MTFWSGKRVFITGHTGFKGSWLSLWLQRLGAKVTGYALEPQETPNLFQLAKAAGGMVSITGDIRNSRRLKAAMKTCKPDIVFHLAAQPLVRASYQAPVETFDVNVIGTVKVLEAVRSCSTVRAVVNVTSDKCYDNRERIWPYRETDRLGGHDPYSASKACAELVSDSYRRSFFNDSVTSLCTVRSGNVIGGGDWAQDRLVPDMIRGLLCGKSIRVREPQAVRPWQHVLDPLHGYLLLAEKLYEEGARWAEAWNFGPDHTQPLTVGEIASELLQYWGAEDFLNPNPTQYARTEADESTGNHKPHEAGLLLLDSNKAKSLLGWRPLLDTRSAIRWTVDWYKAYAASESNARDTTLKQIQAYESLYDIHPKHSGLPMPHSPLN